MQVRAFERYIPLTPVGVSDGYYGIPSAEGFS